MCWTPRHDEILVQEILLFQPWNQKKAHQKGEQSGLPFRQSKSDTNTQFWPSVDQRSVRDHFRLLEGKFVKKQNEEERATGISPDEDSEFDNGMADIIQQFRDFDLMHSQEKLKKDEAGNKEKEAAEEFRRAFLETYRDSQKRNSTDSEAEGSSKKKRKSETETVAYLREKNKCNVSLQEKQLAFQREELDLRRQQMDNFNQMLVNSQQQTTAILQQQQQLSMALLQFLNNKDKQ